MNNLRQQKKNEWQRNSRKEFVRVNGFSTNSHYSTGGLRKEVLIRDGFKCVKCEMTAEEHQESYGRPITIDHKDRNRKNNCMENLQTLCLSCHGRKDLLPRLRERKFLPFVQQMKSMRSVGMTYQEIADELKCSSATVWKYLTKNRRLL